MTAEVPTADSTASRGTESRVALIGIPLDANSSHLFGAAAGPTAIRRVLASGSGNNASERGVDVLSRIDDLGDVVVDNVAGSVTDAASVSDAITPLAAASTPFIALGGDHSITFPILRALAGEHGPLTVVHIDAHPDLYDDLDGNPLSHASPFARSFEAGCIDRLVQIGIRTANAHQRDQAARWSVQMIGPRELGRFEPTELDGSVYLSVDLDGLDPSVAPGVSHHEPGGLTMRELLDIVDALPPLVGADVVELNPERDLVEMTAAVAAKLVKEIAGHMLTG